VQQPCSNLGEYPEISGKSLRRKYLYFSDKEEVPGSSPGRPTRKILRFAEAVIDATGNLV
jgi:hypothetical protein